MAGNMIIKVRENRFRLPPPPHHTTSDSFHRDIRAGSISETRDYLPLMYRAQEKSMNAASTWSAACLTATGLD